MSQLVEFATNNSMLFAALLVVLALIVKAEMDARFSGVNQLSPAEAVRYMNASDTVVVDVRESNEYSGGHIKGAIHIPVGKLKDRLNELEKHRAKQILTYCRSGARSGQACKILKKSGFDSVSNLAGGVMAWSSANLPLTNR